VSKRNKIPPEISDHWPEIFNDIEIKSVPIEYLRSLHIHFLDGKVWEINLEKNKRSNQSPNDIENSLEDLIEEYEDVIDTIDFRLDTEKVKNDITKRTKVFMKKRK